MRRLAKLLPLAVLLILVASLILCPFVNDRIAEHTADRLKALPLPAQTSLVESVYRAGKLVGNGNGMQYFGAILIKSARSEEELAAYYAQLSENGSTYTVAAQTQPTVTVIEHGALSFSADIDGGEYYIVYTFGNYQGIFSQWDLRGH